MRIFGPEVFSVAPNTFMGIYDNGYTEKIYTDYI